MSGADCGWISEEESLALAEGAEEKHKYFRGEIFAMAGGSPEHNLIAGNVLRELSIQLETAPCLSITGRSLPCESMCLFHRPGRVATRTDQDCLATMVSIQMGA